MHPQLSNIYPKGVQICPKREQKYTKMRHWGALGEQLGQNVSKGIPKGANGTKMEPEWSQNGAKIETKIVQKSSKIKLVF